MDGAGETPDQRHLQPIQHPGDAEGDDNPPMEPAPGQAVEPGGHVGLEAVTRGRAWRVAHAAVSSGKESPGRRSGCRLTFAGCYGQAAKRIASTRASKRLPVSSVSAPIAIS